jgi:hypothetical protein
MLISSVFGGVFLGAALVLVICSLLVDLGSNWGS